MYWITISRDALLSIPVRAKKTAGRRGRGDTVGLPLYPSDVTLMPTPECFWSSEKNCRKLRSRKPCRGVKWQCYSRGAGAHGETYATPPAVYFARTGMDTVLYSIWGACRSHHVYRHGCTLEDSSWGACRTHHMYAGAHVFLDASWVLSSTASVVCCHHSLRGQDEVMVARGSGKTMRDWGEGTGVTE